VSVDVLETTLHELRREFDAAFVDPTSERPLVEDFLSLRLGGDPYAFRLHEISGLFADKPIVKIPSFVPELRGIVGLRSVILPVYDLGALLGYPKTRDLRWIVALGQHSLGLGFATFEGQARVPLELVSGDSAQAAGKKHVHGVTQHDGVRPIIDLESLSLAIRGRVEGRTEKGV
jgi:chemotaxis signal transduction protein